MQRVPGSPAAIETGLASALQAQVGGVRVELDTRPFENFGLSDSFARSVACLLARKV